MFRLPFRRVVNSSEAFLSLWWRDYLWEVLHLNTCIFRFGFLVVSNTVQTKGNIIPGGHCYCFRPTSTVAEHGLYSLRLFLYLMKNTFFYVFLLCVTPYSVTCSPVWFYIECQKRQNFNFFPVGSSHPPSTTTPPPPHPDCPLQVEQFKVIFLWKVECFLLGRKKLLAIFYNFSSVLMKLFWRLFRLILNFFPWPGERGPFG